MILNNVKKSALGEHFIYVEIRAILSVIVLKNLPKIDWSGLFLPTCPYVLNAAEPAQKILLVNGIAPTKPAAAQPCHPYR